jgi:hypothetical protein
MATVHFFKKSGKWYTEEDVPWVSTGGLVHEEFYESLRLHLSGRLQGMTAVCIDPPHEHGCPLMTQVPEEDE